MSKINIEKIKDGMEINNYKELCKLIGADIKTGKSRQLQLKDFKRYFDFEKIEGSQKIKIIKINEEVKEKVDNRKLGNNSKFLEIGEALILDMLVRAKDNSICLSKNVLFYQLGCYNKEYMEREKNSKKLCEKYNYDYDMWRHFEFKTYNNCKSNTDRLLKKLASKALIILDDECIRYCKLKSNAKLNEEMEIKLENDDIKEQQTITISKNRVFETADKKFRTEIMGYEKEYMKSIGAVTYNQVMKMGKWPTMINAVKKILWDKYNISYYYRAYEINFNMEHIQEELMTIENECFFDQVLDVQYRLDDDTREIYILNKNKAHYENNIKNVKREAKKNDDENLKEEQISLIDDWIKICG